MQSRLVAVGGAVAGRVACREDGLDSASSLFAAVTPARGRVCTLEESGEGPAGFVRGAVFARCVPDTSTGRPAVSRIPLLVWHLLELGMVHTWAPLLRT